MAHIQLGTESGRFLGNRYSALLLDSDVAHAERLITQVLAPQNVAVEHVRSSEYALVIVNVSANGPPWHRILQRLEHACQRVNGRATSLFLCVSETPKETGFILRIEQMGARYAYEQ